MTQATAASWLAALDDPNADRDYRPGHARMHALLAGAELHRPRLRIRIAGTNGKGSSAFMLARALRAAGLTTGLYTSPHIHEFNERIRINGIPVTDDVLIPVLETMVPVARVADASWFEAATVLALHCFSKARVDVEILEAGVGARLDATTVVPADMALITPIGLDHPAWLGDTLEKIAGEKAYAMDGCRWAISAPQSRVVRQALCRHRADIEFAGRAAALPPLSMAGEHQHTNAGLAWAAIQRLLAEGKLPPQAEHMARAIAETRLPGRLQPVKWGGRTLWLDAAHNRHAIQALLPCLPGLADPFDAILVFTRQDRDLSDALPLLRPFSRRIVAQHHASGQADATYDCLQDALEAEVATGTRGSFLVLGSFTSVAAAEKWCMEKAPGLV